MITYYSEKDLISFARYVLSEERSSKFKISDDDNTKLEDKLREVYKMDLENWKYIQEGNIPEKWRSMFHG